MTSKVASAEPEDAGQAVAAKVRGVLASRRTMFLGTAAADRPWVAGVFFAESDLFTLALVLETSGTTLANIRANPNVALAVSSGSPFEPFLQGDAEAVILTGEDALEATKQALRAKAPEIEPFFQAPLTAVSLRVRRWRATDVASGWLPGKVLAAPA